MSDSLHPRNHAERLALFRAQVLGSVLHRTLARGELTQELQQLSQRRFRAPGADITRSYAVPTLLRWYRAYAKGGLKALIPTSRALGNALTLTKEQRELLLEIRREHPSAEIGRASCRERVQFVA